MSKDNKQKIFALIEGVAKANNKQDATSTANLYSSIEALLKADPSIINEKNESQHTPLLNTLTYKNPDIYLIELFINAEADVNAKTRSGQTPLKLASQEGYDKVVELLLNAGANANATDNQGTSALCASAARGHDKVVELLLNAGADANAKNHQGTSTICIAVQKGQLKIMKLLLEKKASFDTKTGKDALFMAVFNRHCELVELLLKAKADISETGTVGVNSILGMAIKKGNIKIVEALIDTKNSKIFGQIHHHANYLELTTKNKNLELTKLLLKELSFPSSQIQVALNYNQYLLSSAIDEASNYLNLEQKQGKDTKNIDGLLITMKESRTLVWSNNKIVESVNTLLNNKDIYNLIPNKIINDFLTVKDIHNLLKKAQGTNLKSIKFISPASSQDTTPTSTKHSDKTQEKYSPWNDEDNTTLSTFESSNNNSNVSSSSNVIESKQTGNENNQSDVDTTGSSTEYSTW